MKRRMSLWWTHSDVLLGDHSFCTPPSGWTLPRSLVDSRSAGAPALSRLTGRAHWRADDRIRSLPISREEGLITGSSAERPGLRGPPSQDRVTCWGLLNEIRVKDASCA